MGKEYTTASEGAAEKVIGSKQTGGVHWVAERDVDKDALHDDENGCAVDDDANGGHDPVNGGAGGPCKDKEANGWAEGGEEGGREAGFLEAEAVLDCAWVDVEVEVAGVAGDADDAGD